MFNKHILLVQCSDKVGLVAAISGVLAENQQNIITMREFVDRDSGQFFSRVEYAGDDSNHKIIHESLQYKLGKAAIIRMIPMESEKRIVVLVTKEFHCLQDILVKHYFGRLGANVVGVIGNHPDLEEFTTRFSLPFFHISRKDKDKKQFEEELLKKIDSLSPDYLVLAKFMQILSEDFVNRFPNKIINIHHSFLPAFIGANPYKQAYQRGVKIIGATAHFVTADLDNGPIITQETMSVDHNYNSKMMRMAGQEIERGVLNNALNLVFSDRVFIVGNKTVVFE